MKFTLPLAVAVLASLSSCDKVRTLAVKLAKNVSATPAATDPSAPATSYTGSVVSEIAEVGYNQLLEQTGRVVIIDFYADWCGPCRRLGPILHDIANEKQGLVLVGKVNVDNARAFASSQGVSSIPDVRIFRDGKEVDRFVGLPGEAEVHRRIEAQLKNLPPLPAEPAPPAQPASTEPVTQPMGKDWLPPGMQRR